jgi:hypothetical protein
MNQSENQYPLLFRIFASYLHKLETGEDDASSVGSSIMPEE